MTPSDLSQINRANAQHSTGPRTSEGKQKSSLNALRHGLTGQIVVMPTEDLQAYRRHLDSFTTEYQPKGATEENLVQSLADTSWRLNRVAALESNVLSLGMGTSDDPLKNAMSIAAALESQTKALANLSMHTQRLSRQFERTVDQLRALQKERKAQETRDLNELLDIREMYASAGDTLDPAEIGFVFSDAEIQARALARTRAKLADEAYRFLK
jgi:hypothetical protein